MNVYPHVGGALLLIIDLSGVEFFRWLRNKESAYAEGHRTCVGSDLSGLEVLGGNYSRVFYLQNHDERITLTTVRKG